MLFQYYTSYSGTGRGVFQTLVDWGLIDAILPFILIFVLLFAILQKIGMFKDDAGKPDRKISGLLALVIAAIVVVPHVVQLYPPEQDPINIINQFLPSTAVILIAILAVILLLGLAGAKVPSLMQWAIALAALGFLIVMILMAVIPGFFPTFYWLSDPSMQALVIILLIMGLVGWFVIREPTDEGLGEFVNKWFGSPPNP
jgi:peptidoglycan/LPS O-acetylase OafA/YrhL